LPPEGNDSWKGSPSSGEISQVVAEDKGNLGGGWRRRGENPRRLDAHTGPESSQFPLLLGFQGLLVFGQLPNKECLKTRFFFREDSFVFLGKPLANLFGVHFLERKAGF